MPGTGGADHGQKNRNREQRATPASRGDHAGRERNSSGCPHGRRSHNLLAGDAERASERTAAAGALLSRLDGPRSDGPRCEILEPERYSPRVHLYHGSISAGIRPVYCEKHD